MRRNNILVALVLHCLDIAVDTPGNQNLMRIFAMRDQIVPVLVAEI